MSYKVKKPFSDRVEVNINVLVPTYHPHIFYQIVASFYTSKVRMLHFSIIYTNITFNIYFDGE